MEIKKISPYIDGPSVGVVLQVELDKDVFQLPAILDYYLRRYSSRYLMKLDRKILELRGEVNPWRYRVVSDLVESMKETAESLEVHCKRCLSFIETTISKSFEIEVGDYKLQWEWKYIPEDSKLVTEIELPEELLPCATCLVRGMYRADVSESVLRGNKLVCSYRGSELERIINAFFPKVLKEEIEFISNCKLKCMDAVEYEYTFEEQKFKFTGSWGTDGRHLILTLEIPEEIKSDPYAYRILSKIAPSYPTVEIKDGCLTVSIDKRFYESMQQANREALDALHTALNTTFELASQLKKLSLEECGA